MGGEVNLGGRQGQSSPLLWDERNQRLKVFSWELRSLESEEREWISQAIRRKCDKVIIYAKYRDVAAFQDLGYLLEGRIDGFFAGRHAYLLAKFLTPERQTSREKQRADDILHLSLTKAVYQKPYQLPCGFVMRVAGSADAEPLARLYRSIFPLYPTPIGDPEYIKNNMAQGTNLYALVEKDGEIVCAASAEIDRIGKSAELTDCATIPELQGRGLLQALFVELEEQLAARGVYYLYTLTRAVSAGMNITAAKMGYVYRGRLINNCVISTGFEDMNIWVKPLRPAWD